MPMDNKKQIEDWSRRYGKPISETEYKNIYENLNGFFTVLKDWDEVEKRSNENDRDKDIRSRDLSR